MAQKEEVQNQSEVQESAETTSEQESNAQEDGVEKSKAEKVQAKNFQSIQDSSGDKTPLNVNFILDIPLDVNVEVGKAQMVVNDLLQLGEGSVIELEKMVGEPFDIFANEKQIAKGEIVVINERFGVRVTEILSPKERVENLVE